MCKHLPPAAAETLLMDVYAMKNFLMNLPNIDSSSTKQVPASFRKIVENGMVKSEHLLQAILSPHDDINRFVDSYKQLMIGEDRSAEMLAKALELKGLKKNQQTAIIEAYWNWGK